MTLVYDPKGRVTTVSLSSLEYEPVLAAAKAAHR
jgi:hypothetical protein